MALLLDYPGESLQAHIAVIRGALEAEPRLSSRACALLDPLLRNFEQKPLLELQATYSDLFDSSRTLSLHFFEHIHGESRERGQAMIDLGEQYIEHGCFMRHDELPDYIPIFLEFVSCLSTEEARDWLSQPAHVFAALAQRLDERQSAYAGVFHLLLHLAGEKPDPQSVRELLAQSRQAQEASVEDDWEEEPVTFVAPRQKTPAGGVITRLKAAGKLIISSRDT